MAKKNKKRKSCFGWLAGKLLGLALLILVTAAVVLLALRGVTYFTNRITAQNGVDETVYLPVCGQEQFLRIRGENIENPVVIWLHGGPTSPDAFVNYYFMKDLLKDYTFICWDQRGCGRTYFRNRENDPVNQTASFEQAQEDLYAITEYACQRFHVDKVIIAGHSYGSMLGSKFVLDHPEKVSCYIGIGQMVTMQSEHYAYNHALELAKEQGTDTAAMEEAYEAYSQKPSLQNLMALRKLTSPYHQPKKSANSLLIGAISPYMGVDDMRWFLKQMGGMDQYYLLNHQLFDAAFQNDVRSFGMRYQVPVGFISGSEDWTTPVRYSRLYYQTLSAPEKYFEVVEGCGHTPQLDDPAAFCRIFRQMVEKCLD